MLFTEQGRELIIKCDMMAVKIKQYKNKDCEIVSGLFPEDWNFDFKKFISLHHNQNYFKSFILSYFDIPIGFGNLLIFGKIGWIGNIVVEESFREKGFGTSLTKYLIEQGEKAGVKTFNLIATESGKFLYYKTGFRTELIYEFYRPADSNKKHKLSSNICVADKAAFPDIADIDLAATNEKRGMFIKQYLSKTKFIINPDGEPKGFYIENLGDGLIIARESIIQNTISAQI